VDAVGLSREAGKFPFIGVEVYRSAIAIIALVLAA
jgi:hypothetical protein